MILGIDPGLANVGWGVVEDYKLIGCGCVETVSSMDLSDRLGRIYGEVEKLIKKYKPKAMAIEGLYFAKNVKSAIQVAEAMGVIKVCGVKNGLEVIEYTPLQIKMALTGYGRADKDQVEYMVKNLLGLDEITKPDHAVDAVAVALTHMTTNRELVS
ncbi:crossover junction endodeoxyribonuclease RuvC [Patescibacteria group bacterium]|nr:crossover junction endodeoxyribonuclease RuvC [Patescibacteria group bacterium]MCG2701958.1 crossover junction endodeoxyribonuclease RuvC [Candidatus Parcubacteria bacterium]MBU4265040.1 crossover junction endodeoxyribonuclease RuvC [Patescibacteria group bacterium]MBU4390193.1 crossover junction endodeoxyribonuclease RuvC [Patescibacteria group bacterium]MBU4397443.1 crossover junction endodeoxyribonuclease RuvC [Patescibacteria group bacterium]